MLTLTSQRPCYILTMLFSPIRARATITKHRSTLHFSCWYCVFVIKFSCWSLLSQTVKRPSKACTSGHSKMPSQSFILSLCREKRLHAPDPSCSEPCYCTFVKSVVKDALSPMVNKKSSLIISEERKYFAKPPHVLVEGGGAKLGLGYYFYLGDQDGINCDLISYASQKLATCKIGCLSKQHKVSA